MSVINAVPLLAAAGGDYQISRSVRLRSSASAYFNRTPASAGDYQKWTWSGWIKLGNLSTASLFSAQHGSGTDASVYTAIYYINNRLELQRWNGATYQIQVASNNLLRDPSAWYHFVVTVDTPQATAANRVKLYINGIETSYSTATYPSQNFNTDVNTTQRHALGALVRLSPNNFSSFFDGYLTEINFIDGQALTPSSFGETDSVTGVWKPKKYLGTYGTNGFYLDFSDNSNNTAATIGKDYSGNGNNWTPNNISVTSGVTYDSMLDVPTNYADGGNGRGNYCVLNTLDKNANVSILNGNLNMNTSAVNYGVRGSIGVNSGKWYWEAYVSAIGSTNVDVGIADSAWDRTYVGSASSSWGYFSSGQKYNNATATSYGATYTTGDTIGVAFDADAGTLTFYKNGTSQGQAFSGVSSSNPIFPAVSGQTSSTLVTNFGQCPFSYTPPSGFVALNTQNLPDSTIKRGNQYFDATTYTGNGSTQTITNSGGFTPDLVWHKGRSVAYSNSLVDAVRGNSNILISNTTDAESNPGAQLDITTGGFISTYRAANLANNQNAATYVGWQWKAGNSSSSNTSGSITSTVSVNATAGFSVVTFSTTAVSTQTWGHGLGVAPKMVIVKSKGIDNWYVYHASLGNASQIQLNSTAASTATNLWNSTTPSSTIVTFGAGFASAANYVAYCFSAVAGYSAFGSYTGNGSSDGPFVFLGFRPRFIMTKRTDSTSDWHILDTSRNTYNVAGSALFPNSSSSETTNGWYDRDFLSNGFKIRASVTEVNASGGTYIYAAFAENPFKNALAR